MRVRLLGPVEVDTDGTAVPVPGLRRKAVLAALALRGGAAMSVDELVTVVWGDTAPATAATTLQSHVSRLRGMLGARDTIVARRPGYQLNLGPEPSDVQVAERLVGEAARTGDPAGLRTAVALWRGRPLADLTHLDWFAGHVRRLDDLLLRARHALVEARLVLGEHVELIPELEEMSRRQPFHEQTHAQLMLALYRAGRQTDALSVYRRLRDALGDELGVDPSPPLRDLEAAILRHDETLDRVAPPTPRTTLAMVPPAPAGFTGRTAEMGLLDTARQVAVVCGPAGVGKTSLALHWAHRSAPRFPDGQLYVDLRGFDPDRPPLRPAEVVPGFLDALGVPPHRLPATVDGQIGLYRGLLADRRMLVVLDNAADSAQVRPLLPGSPECRTVVTSRHPLTPLVAAQGGTTVPLDLFTVDEARDLLTQRLGAARVAADPAATEAVIARCARLPLALAIVAARAATRPSFPLATFAAELSSSVRVPVVPEPPADGVLPEDDPGPGWFAAESAVLVAAIERAAAHGFPTHTWQLAHALGAYQNMRGDWEGMSATHRRALDVAVEPVGRGLAEEAIAFGHFRAERFDAADIHFRRALVHFAVAGSAEGQLLAHRRLTNLWLERGDPDRALDHGRRAQALVAGGGDPVQAARVQNHVGWCLVMRGDHAEALGLCRGGAGRAAAVRRRLRRGQYAGQHRLRPAANGPAARGDRFLPAGVRVVLRTRRSLSAGRRPDPPGRRVRGGRRDGERP